MIVSRVQFPALAVVAHTASMPTVFGYWLYATRKVRCQGSGTMSAGMLFMASD